jgi:hypothetical protein
MIDLDLSTDIITDSNHYMRRYFRCWIDGSYKGEGHYHRNCRFVRHNFNNDKALRAMAIGEWCDYLASENDCSRSTVQRHMVQHFTGGQLDALNTELIDDLRDLVRDEIDS